MKKGVFLAVVALSVLASVATTYVMNSRYEKSQKGDIEKSDSDSTNGQMLSDLPDLTAAAKLGVEAVVYIENITKGGSSRARVYKFFGIPFVVPENESARVSSGSGVIVSEDVYIVTNNHVIDGASELRVTLNDKRSYLAKVVSQDPSTDIALLKIEESGLHWLPFGDSDRLQLGEWVLAIGNPFNLTSTVTAGIVSAKARNLYVNNSEFRIESFIQTDAAVNPGNSGGALLNVRGEIVGINTVIKSPTGSYAGYSFAVPASIVSKIVDDMIKYGSVQRGVLGVSMLEINDEFVRKYGQKYGIERAEGVLIMGVAENSAADDAGIEPGDLIMSIDSIQTNSPSMAQEIIAQRRPDDKIKISIKRGGQVKHFEVVLRNKGVGTER
jgi:S1-C subfamily serine protease